MESYSQVELDVKRNRQEYYVSGQICGAAFSLCAFDDFVVKIAELKGAKP